MRRFWDWVIDGGWIGALSAALLLLLVALVVGWVRSSNACRDGGGVVAGKSAVPALFMDQRTGVAYEVENYSILLDGPKGSCWVMVGAEEYARAEKGDQWPRLPAR